MGMLKMGMLKMGTVAAGRHQDFHAKRASGHHGALSYGAPPGKDRKKNEARNQLKGGGSGPSVGRRRESRGGKKRISARSMAMSSCMG